MTLIIGTMVMTGRTATGLQKMIDVTVGDMESMLESIGVPKAVDIVMRLIPLRLQCTSQLQLPTENQLQAQ